LGPSRKINQSPTHKHTLKSDLVLGTCLVCHNNFPVYTTFQELHALTFEDVINAAHSDHQYQDLLKIASEGFPAQRNLTEPTHLQEFWEVRDRLFTYNGVVLMGKCVVIPCSLRKTVLHNQHSANEGMTGMKFRANQCIYWPGMGAAILNHCNVCV